MASTNRPEYAVRIEDGPGWITDTGVGPSFHWELCVLHGEVARFVVGDARTRQAAWACALAALKGEMHLERSRH